ncbi:hypothetical protein M0D21_01190 [Aquimarina sp. D1M17]|uniref:hypothetical protein n=1 Tax=Aquimarina acroporae TaxID=2937283 RepID=UPI0020C09FAC|nr:hypothetical protein [Aquimarina acroporae]MCK8520157.1 hypothetical protein [Aquimarina acroporae]
MKYHLINNKDQETRSHLLADAFGSILGMGLYTSVVNHLLGVMSEAKGIKKPRRALFVICKNLSEVLIRENYTSRKALIS